MDSADQDLTGIDGERQTLASARSSAYRLFAESMTYPDDEFCEWVEQGGVRNVLTELMSTISEELFAGEDAEALGPDLESVGEKDELAIEYTRLFDAGASGPPCPLYGGLYGGARMKTMEEAVRFYNHFGLTLSGEPRELPDHLVTQLEFLHYLAFREVEALQKDVDPGPYQRAQRDFIGRHLGSWLPKLCQKLEKEEAAPYFKAVLGALSHLLAWDRARLVREHGAEGNDRPLDTTSLVNRAAQAGTNPTEAGG